MNVKEQIRKEFGWKPGEIKQNARKKMPVPNMWDGTCIGHLKPERYLLARDEYGKLRLFVSNKKRGSWLLWC